MSDNLEQRLRALEAKLLINQRDTWTRVLLGRVLLQAGRVAEARAAFTRVLTDEPKNADGHHGLGKVRATEGDSRGALAAYNQALGCDPNHVGAHAELILYHEGRDEHAVATAHYTAVLRTKGEDVDWLRRAADNLIITDADAEAAKLLERAVKKAPADTELTLRLGLCYERLRRANDARDTLEPLCRPEVCPIAGLLGLGSAYLQLSCWEDARFTFLRALSKASDSDPGRLGLLQSLVPLERYAEAFTEYGRLSERPRDSAPARALGAKALLGLARYQECLDLLGPILARPDTEADVLLTAARAELLLQRPSEAVTHLERALRLTPEDVTGWHLLAQARIALEHHSAASDCFARLLALRPDDPALQFERARHEQLHGSLTLALAGYRRTFELDDAHALACLHAAECALALEQPSEAERLLERSIAVDSRLGQAHKLLGKLRHQAGRFDPAVTPLEDAARLLPEDVEVGKLLGGCLLQLGRVDRACQVLERTFTRAPTDVEVARLLAKASTKMGRHDRAVTVLTAAVRVADDDANLVFELGLAEECLRNLPAARRSLQAATSLDRTLGPAFVALGRVCFELSDMAAAVTALESAERLLPEERSVCVFLGRALTELGRFADAQKRLLRASVEAPTDKEVAFALGRVFMGLQDFARANTELERALLLGRQQPDTYYLLGVVADKLENGGVAVEQLRRAIQLRPDFVEAHSALHRVYAAHGQHQEAVQSAREVLRLSPDNLAIRVSMGESLEKLDRFAEASEVWLALLGEGADVPRLMLRLGIVESRLGRYEDAIAHLAEGLDEDPSDAMAWDVLATCHTRLSQPAEVARVLTRATSLHPDSKERFRTLGLVEVSLGHEPSAIAALEKAVELGANDSECCLSLGRLHRAAARRSIVADDHAAALASTDAALRWLTEDVDLLLDKARCLLELGRHVEARPVLERAATLAPTRIDIRLLLGTVLLKVEDHEAAVTTYRQVTKLDPTSFEATRQLGRSLSVLGRKKEAISTLNTALQLSPDAMDLAFELGSLLFSEQRPKEARAWLEKAAEARPLDFQTQLTLGLCERDLGDDAAATRSFARALAQQPTSEQVLLEQGECLMRLARFEQATVPLCALVDTGRASVHTQELLATALIEQKAYERAISPLTVVYDAESRDEVALQLLDCYVRTKRVDDVVALSTRILEQNPECIVALTELAHAELTKNRLDAALFAFERILSQEPTNQEAQREVPRLRTLRAELLIEADPRAAVQELDAALQVAPSDPTLWFRLAKVRDRLGDLQSALDAVTRALSLDERHVDALLLRGELLGKAGLWRDAEEVLSRSVAVDPQSFAGWKRLGDVFERLEQLPKAIFAYEHAVALKADDLPCWERLAGLYAETGNKRRAAEALTSIRGLRAFSTDELRSLGLLWFGIDAFEEAERVLGEVLGRIPNDEECLLLHAESLRRVDRERDSIVPLTRLVRVAPTHPQAISRLGLALHRAGRHEEAVVALEKSRTQKTPPVEILRALADSYGALPNPEKQLATLMALSELTPDDPAMWLEIGELRLGLGHSRAGTAALGRAHELNGDVALAHRIAALWLAELDAGGPDLDVAEALRTAQKYAAGDAKMLAVCAERLRASGDPIVAEQACRAALAIDDSVDMGTLLGELLVLRGEMTAAIPVFEHVLDLRVDALAALVGAARAHMSLGNHDRAELLLRQATRLAPGRSDIHGMLSGLLAASNRLAEAVDVQRRAVDQGPSDVDSQLAFAELLIQQNNHLEAMAVLQKTLRQQPDCAPVASRLVTVLEALGRYGELLEVVEIVLVAEPGKLEATLQKGRALIEVERYSDAIAVLAKLSASPGPENPAAALLSRAHQRRAAELERQEQWKAAATDAISASKYAQPSTEWLLFIARNLVAAKELHEAYTFAKRAVELSPTAATWLGLAEIETLLGRFREAVMAFEALLECDRQNLRGWAGLGLSLAELGRHEEAIDALNRAVAILPEPATCLTLGRLHELLGHPKEVAESLTRLSRLRPLSHSEMLMVARAHRVQKDYQAAAEFYADALEMSENDPEALLALGESLLLGGRPQEAISPFEKVRRLVPNHPQVDEWLARAYAQVGQHAEAISAAERQLARGANDAMLTILSESSQALGKSDQHADALRRLAERKSDDPAAYLELSRAQIKAKDRASAIASAERAWELSRGQLGGETLGLLWLEEAEECLRQGARDRAIQGLDRALRADPESAMLLLAVARHYHQCGEYELAVRTVSSVAPQKPEYADAQLLGGSCLEALGRPSEALAWYERTCEKKPDSLPGLQGAGRVELALGRMAAGRRTLLRALALLPTDDTIAESLLGTITRAEDANTRRQSLEELVRLRPADVRAARELCHACLALGQHGRVVELLTPFANRPPVAFEVWFFMATACLALGRDAEAEQAALFALQQQPQDDGAARVLGLARARQGRQTDAIAALERAYASAPTAELSTELVSLYKSQCQILEQAGDKAGMVAALSRCLELLPNQPNLRILLARTLATEQRVSDALTVLGEGLSPIVEHLPLWLMIGELHLEARRPELAEPAYRTAVNLSPHDVEARQGLGLTLSRLGRTEDALALLSALEPLPEDAASVHEERARLFEQTANAAAAVGELSRLGQLRPLTASEQRRLGILLSGLGRDEESLAVLGPLLAFDRSDIDVALAFSDVARRMGQKDAAVQALRGATQVAPERTELWRRLGESLAEAGRHQEAVAAFERVLQLGDTSLPVEEALVAAARAAGNTPRWLEALRARTRLDPRRAVFHAELALGLVEVGSLGEAKSSFEMALRLEIRPDWLRQLADCHGKLGEHSQRLEVLMKVAEMLPNEAQAQLDYGLARHAAGHKEAALAALSAALKLDPALGPAKAPFAALARERARELLQAQDVEASLALFERAAQHVPPTVDDLFDHASCQSRLGRAPQAIAILERAQSLSPSEGRVSLLLSSLLMRTGDSKRARAVCELGLSHNPRSVGLAMMLAEDYTGEGRFDEAARTLASAYPGNERDTGLAEQYALALSRIGRDQEAAQVCQLGLEVDPNSVVLLRQLGVIYAGQGWHAQAAPLFAAALKADPSQPSLCYMAARSLGEAGQLAEALQMLRWGTSQFQNERSLFELLASTARTANDLEAAIFAHENLVRLSPNDAALRFSLGQLYLAGRRYQQAVTEYRALQNLDPRLAQKFEVLLRNPSA